MTPTLTLREFLGQLNDYLKSTYEPVWPDPYKVVIRGPDGDFCLAAVHLDRDGTRLIFDLGQPIKE